MDQITFVCVLGIGTVFIGLICIVILCSLVSFLCKKLFSDKKEDVFTAAPTVASAPVAAPAAAGGAGSVKVEAGAAGKIFKIEAKVGQAVKKGDAVVILEAMKMEIPVVAPQDGTVASIDVAVGDAVEAGAVLATLN